MGNCATVNVNNVNQTITVQHQRHPQDVDSSPNLQEKDGAGEEQTGTQDGDMTTRIKKRLADLDALLRLRNLIDMSKNSPLHSVCNNDPPSDAQIGESETKTQQEGQLETPTSDNDERLTRDQVLQMEYLCTLLHCCSPQQRFEKTIERGESLHASRHDDTKNDKVKPLTTPAAAVPSNTKISDSCGRRQTLPPQKGQEETGAGEDTFTIESDDDDAGGDGVHNEADIDDHNATLHVEEGHYHRAKQLIDRPPLLPPPANMREEGINNSFSPATLSPQLLREGSVGSSDTKNSPTNRRSSRGGQIIATSVDEKCVHQSQEGATISTEKSQRRDPMIINECPNYFLEEIVGISKDEQRAMNRQKRAAAIIKYQREMLAKGQRWKREVIEEMWNGNDGDSDESSTSENDGSGDSNRSRRSSRSGEQDGSKSGCRSNDTSSPRIAHSEKVDEGSVRHSSSSRLFLSTVAEEHGLRASNYTEIQLNGGGKMLQSLWNEANDLMPETGNNSETYAQLHTQSRDHHGTTTKTAPQAANKTESLLGMGSAVVLEDDDEHLHVGGDGGSSQSTDTERQHTRRKNASGVSDQSTYRFPPTGSNSHTLVEEDDELEKALADIRTEMLRKGGEEEDNVHPPPPLSTSLKIENETEHNVCINHKFIWPPSSSVMRETSKGAAASLESSHHQVEEKRARQPMTEVEFKNLIDNDSAMKAATTLIQAVFDQRRKEASAGAQLADGVGIAHLILKEGKTADLKPKVSKMGSKDPSSLTPNNSGDSHPLFCASPLSAAAARSHHQAPAEVGGSSSFNSQKETRPPQSPSPSPPTPRKVDGLLTLLKSGGRPLFSSTKSLEAHTPRNDTVSEAKRSPITHSLHTPTNISTPAALTEDGQAKRGDDEKTTMTTATSVSRLHWSLSLAQQLDTSLNYDAAHPGETTQLSTTTTSPRAKSGKALFAINAIHQRDIENHQHNVFTPMTPSKLRVGVIKKRANAQINSLFSSSELSASKNDVAYASFATALTQYFGEALSFFETGRLESITTEAENNNTKANGNSARDEIILEGSVNPATEKGLLSNNVTINETAIMAACHQLPIEQKLSPQLKYVISDKERSSPVENEEGETVRDKIVTGRDKGDDDDVMTFTNGGLENTAKSLPLWKQVAQPNKNGGDDFTVPISSPLTVRTRSLKMLEDTLNGFKALNAVESSSDEDDEEDSEKRIAMMDPPTLKCNVPNISTTAETKNKDTSQDPIAHSNRRAGSEALRGEMNTSRKQPSIMPPHDVDCEKRSDVARQGCTLMSSASDATKTNAEPKAPAPASDVEKVLATNEDAILQNCAFLLHGSAAIIEHMWRRTLAASAKQPSCCFESTKTATPLSRLSRPEDIVGSVFCEIDPHIPADEAVKLSRLVTHRTRVYCNQVSCLRSLFDNISRQMYGSSEHGASLQTAVSRYMCQHSPRYRSLTSAIARVFDADDAISEPFDELSKRYKAISAMLTAAVRVESFDTHNSQAYDYSLLLPSLHAFMLLCAKMESGDCSPMPTGPEFVQNDNILTSLSRVHALGLLFRKNHSQSAHVADFCGSNQSQTEGRRMVSCVGGRIASFIGENLRVFPAQSQGDEINSNGTHEHTKKQSLDDFTCDPTLTFAELSVILYALSQCFKLRIHFVSIVTDFSSEGTDPNETAEKRDQTASTQTSVELFAPSLAPIASQYFPCDASHGFTHEHAKSEEKRREMAAKGFDIGEQQSVFICVSVVQSRACKPPEEMDRGRL